MGFSIGKIFGPGEPPLTEEETHLLTQLQANRKDALYQQIPDNMMTEFMTVIFSDRQLKNIIKKVFHSKLISDKTSLRGVYLEDSIRLSLSMNRFSTRLILHHGVSPQTVAAIMLKDVSA
jgi:uncharacterized membrane protein